MVRKTAHPTQFLSKMAFLWIIAQNNILQIWQYQAVFEDVSKNVFNPWPLYNLICVSHWPSTLCYDNLYFLKLISFRFIIGGRSGVIHLSLLNFKRQWITFSIKICNWSFVMVLVSRFVGCLVLWCSNEAVLMTEEHLCPKIIFNSILFLNAWKSNILVD